MAGGVVPSRDGALRLREVLTSVLFVAAGFAALAVAAVLLLLWGPGIAAPGGWASPHALGLTHVLALGFISSTAIGVLYHIGPRIFGGEVRLPAAGAAVWLLYVAGVALLTTGLVAAGSGVAAAGGACLAAALLALSVHLGAVVAASRRRYLPGFFQVAAVLTLVTVAGLGTALALMLHLGPPPSFLDVLAAKVVLAVGGWLGVLVVGVSYQLVPMFTTTTARARFSAPVLGLLLGGAALTAAASGAAAPAWLRVLCSLPFAAGVALHVADVARMMRARRVRLPGPVTAGQALGALLLVAGTVEGVVAMGGAQPWPQLAVVTALLGWGPVLIAANGVRVVPFIVWQALPPRRRPRAFAPAPAPLGWTGIAAALVAWAATTAAMSTGSAAAATLGGAALAVCAAAVAGIGLSTVRDARRILRRA